MLGLGNTMTASNPVEGIIQLGSFVVALIVNDVPDDENIFFVVAYLDSAINDALNFDGVSVGEKLSGTFTLTVTRLDASDNPVTGATTTGSLFGYKSSAEGQVLLSDTDQASFDVEGTDSDFNPSGAALVDLTSFGDVTDITDNSVDSSNYTASVTFTAPGYTSSTIGQLGNFVAIDTA